MSIIVAISVAVNIVLSSILFRDRLTDWLLDGRWNPAAKLPEDDRDVLVIEDGRVFTAYWSGFEGGWIESDTWSHPANPVAWRKMPRAPRRFRVPST